MDKNKGTDVYLLELDSESGLGPVGEVALHYLSSRPPSLTTRSLGLKPSFSQFHLSRTWYINELLLRPRGTFPLISMDVIETILGEDVTRIR
jgi:hypothetical protein